MNPRLYNPIYLY